MSVTFPIYGLALFALGAGGLGWLIGYAMGFHRKGQDR